MSQEGPLKKQKLLEDAQEKAAKEMAEQEEKGYISSPDMFAGYSSPPHAIDAESDDENEQQSNDVVIQIENDVDVELTSKHAVTTDEAVAWKGMSLDDIMKGCDQPQLPPIKPSEYHRVLFRLPIAKGEVPEAYPRVPETGVEDLWDSAHVRMPNSPQSQYVVEHANGEQRIESRWSVIKKAFAEPIKSSHELADAILSYNSKYARRWDFNALHYFFNEELEDEEREILIGRILPSIIDLALLLPSLITAPIPLLRRHRTRSLSLSQLQAATLLANAFLCTFPRRNANSAKSEYAAFPDINFNRLFCSNGNAKPLQRNVEKLKCVFSYFRRVCDKYPKGVLTFTRRHVERSCLPRWDRLESRLTELHVSSVGTIEDQGLGMLQADFANSVIGGGVLGSGCVQEEIRFVVCPELIVARLFTEELDSTEALVMAGSERFSRYEGYADSFEWTGDFRDETPPDSSGRRRCTIVAIDALNLRNPAVQFAPKCMLREVNKAFVGCCNPDVTARLAPFATGNWGCGAFGGDARLKAVLQLMAAAAAGRPVAYFTFGDNRLRDEIHGIHALLVERRVTIARLWAVLSAYNRHRDGRSSPELYDFISEAVRNNVQFDEPRTKDARRDESRAKANVAGILKVSSHKTNHDPTSRRSRGADAGASTSHGVEPDELERALEASLWETQFLRDVVPVMDDATREAKLARIEGSGKTGAAADISNADCVESLGRKSPVEGRIFRFGVTAENVDDTSQDSLTRLLLETDVEEEDEEDVGPVSPATGGKCKGNGHIESTVNCSAKGVVPKAVIKLNASKSNSPKGNLKITDYFSSSPRNK